MGIYIFHFFFYLYVGNGIVKRKRTIVSVFLSDLGKNPKNSRPTNQME